MTHTHYPLRLLHLLIYSAHDARQVLASAIFTLFRGLNLAKLLI